MKLYPRIVLALVTLVAGISGCATTSDVKEIIATTNAAMVSPVLEQPGSRASDVWQVPVAQIDQIILNYPEEGTLVNHLRLRQAMLLTVFQQGNLAEERWEQIDGSELETERDRSLYENRDALVWWYRRAPSLAPLDDEEKERATRYVTQLTASLSDIENEDIRAYLGTIRAQMDLKLANDADVSTDALEQQVSEEMVDDLEAYVQLFSPAVGAWVQNNPETDVSEGISIADLRQRIWLREMIKEFRETSARLGLSPGWQPQWIGTVDFD